MKAWVSIVGLALCATLAHAEEPKVQVLLLGTFHMANPGHDLHNMKVDDVLAPAPQAELQRVADALAKFKPTKVMVEWNEKKADERYAQFLAGTLAPNRDESIQVGFRLAKQVGLKQVYGIDVMADFPYEAVEKYAQAHGQNAILERESAATEAAGVKTMALLREHGIIAALRHINEPAQIRAGNSFYRQVLRIGAGEEQPGVELLSAWTRRNYLICANLIQHSAPRDRIFVIYGAGHAHLLRQCALETPGFELVEPNDYLPQPAR